MLACLHGHLEVAELLMRAGADVHASNSLVSLHYWHSSTSLCSFPFSNQLGPCQVNACQCYW